MPVFTAAAAAIAGAIGVTSAIGVALINFGVRVLATYVVTSLITRKQDTQGPSATSSPGRTSVSANTTNKLPVVYGNAYMGGIMIDAKISTDQQYMWYVLALSEKTDTGTITYEDPNNPGYPLIYWGDKKIQFSASDKTKVTGLIDVNDPAAPVDTKVDGLMYVYLYNNGSNSGLYGAIAANAILAESSIGGGIPADQRWSSTDTMTNTAFMIVRVKYSQDANLTGLQPVSAYVRNSLYQPGSVIYDYLTNARYGCGIPASMVDSDSLTGTNGLNAYSAELITYNDNGVPKTQPRYKINGPIFTTNNCLENLIQLSEACDSWIQWNEAEGKWGVIINRSYTQAGIAIEDLFTVYADPVYVDTDSRYPATNYAYVIGGVDITPVDLNQTYNRVIVEFPNQLIKDQTDQVYLETPANLLNPNEPINQLTMNLNQVNDDVQAQYLANRRLEQNRDDLVVTLSTDYSGIQVDAGDIIRVYHQMYGWTEDQGFQYGKLFRVTQVQETKIEDGSLGARLTMTEYNDQVYDNFDITAYEPAQNTGITDPTVISTPPAPTISNSITTSAVPSFNVNVIAPSPSLGQVTALEFWYAVSNLEPAATEYKLYGTQFYNAGPVYPSNYTQTILVTGLPASEGTQKYYWKVRAVGNRSKSNFSPASSAFVWTPNPTATVTGQNFQTSFEPSPVTVNLLANGMPDLANVTIRLFGLSGPGVVDYSNVTSNSALANNQWRIDVPNIAYNGISFSSAPFEGGNGTFAQWPTPTSITSNVASITVPIFYKDNIGTMYTAPTGIVNVNTAIAGSRGVVNTAYVEVDYDPTYGVATDSQLSGSFFATTGFSPPIDNDSAIFFNPDTNVASGRKYEANATPYAWTDVTLQIPGQAISPNSIGTSSYGPGTITQDKFAANIIFAGNIISFGANIDNPNSPGYWFNYVTGSGRFGGNLSVGDIIEASTLKANTVSAEQIVVGSVTQSASSIDNPEVSIVPYYNWPAGTGNPAWPNNTRGFACEPVTIIPTTDPNDSANTMYQEGSRITVGFTASIFSGVNADSSNVAYENYNLMELWKSGTTSVWDQTINTIRHSYDLTTTKNGGQTIHAVGANGLDIWSQDGGATWATYNNSSTDRVIKGAITYTYTQSGVQRNTNVVGPLQVADGSASGTPTANWGQRGGAAIPPQQQSLKYYYATFVPADGQYQLYSYNAMEACPNTNGSGAGDVFTGTANNTTNAILCGNNGIILYNPSTIPGYYTGWIRENPNTLQNLYAIHAGNIDAGKNFTAIVVGATGTLARSSRTWGSSDTWTAVQIFAEDGVTPLLNDLYGVASDDSPNTGSAKWVAVGQYGTIVTSSDNGANWTTQMLGITQALNAVRYCNGKWVAVGDEGVIFTSTDTVTWTQVQSGLTTRDLTSIDYSPVHNTINIGGQHIVLNSGATTLNFSIVYQWSPAETYNLKRIWYLGSWPETSNLNEPQPQNRIKNNQSISVTVIDRDYVQGQETTYYLVVGNLRGNNGATVWTGGPYLLVTEYKR